MPSLLQRLARLAPYYRPSYPGMLAAFVAAAVGAATEPAIPALMKPLLDRGFVGSERGFALWYVPVAIVGLFIIRGLAAFVGEYALDWANGKSVLRLREAMFERLLDAHPTLFSRYSASGLTNALVHEVQAGTNALVGALMTLVRDSLTVLALFGYLLWLNWRLTVFVVLLAPAFAIVTRAVAKRLRKLAIAGRTTTEDLSYVVEENVLAWRIVRLHVKPHQGVNVGSPLVEMVSEGPLKVRLNAPSRLLRTLREGTPFSVDIDETGKTYAAKVTAINARVDAVAQTVELEGRIEGKNPELLGGMTGVARFRAQP